MATKKSPARAKAPAVTFPVPKDRDELASMLTQLGILTRRMTTVQLDGEGRIAAIRDELAPVLSGLADQKTALLRGMQLWCEANRAALTNSGAIKTVELVTGQIGWRNGLYKVTAPRDVEPVIDAMREHGLDAYIRTVPSINKEAILELNRLVGELKPDDVSEAAKKMRADLLLLNSIPSLRIARGGEEFFATPAELDAATPNTVPGTLLPEAQP